MTGDWTTIESEVASPQVEAPSAPAAQQAAEAMIPAQMLDGGELVVLAVKPSLWFIPLRSLRWLCAALLVSGLTYVNQLHDYRLTLMNTALVLSGLPLLWNSMEWISRCYVLTNRRVMRIRGFLRVEVFECTLMRIQHTELVLTPAERMTRTGTIHLSTAGEPGGFTSWSVIASPLEVHELLRSHILRSRRQGDNSV
jgi:hypothetical protein